tara:strand:- start:100 stop:498 length:399 start_codon:yes stop_codon:yes gene_type:complete
MNTGPMLANAREGGTHRDIFAQLNVLCWKSPTIRMTCASKPPHPPVAVSCRSHLPMEILANLLNQFSWPILIILCLTLGLAPFFPEPHIWEKLKMLASGTLVKPIDIFDLLMHATPFLIAGLKLALMVLRPE